MCVCLCVYICWKKALDWVEGFCQGAMWVKSGCSTFLVLYFAILWMDWIGPDDIDMPFSFWGSMAIWPSLGEIELEILLCSWMKISIQAFSTPRTCSVPQISVFNWHIPFLANFSTIIIQKRLVGDRLHTRWYILGTKKHYPWDWLPMIEKIVIYCINLVLRVYNLHLSVSIHVGRVPGSTFLQITKFVNIQVIYIKWCIVFAFSLHTSSWIL